MGHPKVTWDSLNLLSCQFHTCNCCRQHMFPIRLPTLPFCQPNPLAFWPNLMDTSFFFNYVKSVGYVRSRYDMMSSHSVSERGVL